jgi:hypothetical protein
MKGTNMKNWIGVTQGDGRRTWVNLAHARFIRGVENGRTEINFDNGLSVYVTQTPTEVMTGKREKGE